MAYKYVVIQFLPSIATNEKVNVGIKLHDLTTNLLYTRITKRKDELTRRYPRSELLISIMVENLTEDTKEISDENYLNKLVENKPGVYQRLFFSDVRGGNQVKPIKETLDDVYNTFVLVDESQEI